MILGNYTLCVKYIFRSISVHSYMFFSYLCTGSDNRTSTTMAGKVKDMSLIKQVLQLKQLGESNRGISRKLSINKETVNSYVKTMRANGWIINDLLRKEDPELERLFHAGSPAYSDPRMTDFLSRLPYFREQLTNPKLHVTRQLLYEEYIKCYPNGYGKSQFYFHLKQNLVAQKDCTAVLTGTYNPGEKLMVDFAGDKLNYVDPETGEIIKVEVFVACMPYSDYTYAICVPSQKTEDFLHALGKALEFYGGVPRIVVPDNLKAAVIKADKYEPVLNKAMDDMGNHYGFVTIPCQPVKPTQKAKVENQVQIIYHRIYARLRNRQFFSLEELNAAVSEFLACHNQTRMQQRPYTREEHFHAVEKPELLPLPATPYQMKRYAEVTVQQNGHVYLSCDKHYYSVPYTLIGCKAKMIFTSTLVKVYVKGELVATHRCDRSFGYTSVEEHLASNTLAFTKRSASYYKDRARSVSDALLALFDSMFAGSNGSCPPEYYYKTCDMMLRLQRSYPEDIFEEACEICLENRLFTGKRLENVLKTVHQSHQIRESAAVPEPTGHANMRGTIFFQ